VDSIEICNVCTRKVIIKAAKSIFNSDKICRSYCDFYFGVTFLEHIVDVFEQFTYLFDCSNSVISRVTNLFTNIWAKTADCVFQNCKIRVH